MIKVCAAPGCTNTIDLDKKRFDSKYCSTKCGNRVAVARYRARKGLIYVRGLPHFPNDNVDAIIGPDEEAK
jgi:hypothetical protein